MGSSTLSHTLGALTYSRWNTHTQTISPLNGCQNKLGNCSNLYKNWYGYRLTKNKPTIWPSHTTPGYGMTQGLQVSILQRHLHTGVYCSSTHNGWPMGPSTEDWIKKMRFTGTVDFFSHEEKWSHVIWRKRLWLWEKHTEPVSRWQFLSVAGEWECPLYLSV